jgi:glutaredoxin
MNVMIVATKTCNRWPDLERELQHLGVEYEVVFVEDRPELVAQYGIRHSPNLIVDEQVCFRELPTENELKEFFARL